MGSISTLPPRGRYLAQEVGQLAGMSGNTIGQWAHYGYIGASQSKPGEYPRIYSFQDAAEAIIVHELLDQNVPLAALRPVIERLRERHGDWPLQHTSLETVSDSPMSVASLLVSEDGVRYELGQHGWQRVVEATLDPRRVSMDLHRGGWAVRNLPGLKHIEIDPERLSGRPAIRGRRVPVSLVVELAGTLEGNEILHEDYDLSAAEIQDAQRWWKATANYGDLVAA